MWNSGEQHPPPLRRYEGSLIYRYVKRKSGEERVSHPDISKQRGLTLIQTHTDEMLQGEIREDRGGIPIPTDFKQRATILRE